MSYTMFWDMHSGGGCKEKPFEKIIIEAADQAQAEVIFQNRFGHNPNRVTCTCCGPDYSISTDDSLEQLTGYHRGCAFDKASERYVETPSGFLSRLNPFRPVDEYVADARVLLIPAADVKPSERVGELRPSGYVWQD